MSAQLYFSNSLTVLLDKLSENLVYVDPFSPPSIATPNVSLKTWVQAALAEKKGIVANYSFALLEKTLWSRLADLDLYRQAKERLSAELLDERKLQYMLMMVFQQKAPEEIQKYLHTSEVNDNSNLFSTRSFQLAEQVARLFREYEYSRVQEHGRESLTFLWKDNQACFTPLLPKSLVGNARERAMRLEAWQKTLYHEIFGLHGLRDRLGVESGQYYYTLPQYAEMVLNQKRELKIETAPVYHLFGLSQISPFHRSLIQALSDEKKLPGREAHFLIYTLNPCATYWEDLLTPKEKRQQQLHLLRDQQYAAWRKLADEEKSLLSISQQEIEAEELNAGEEENRLLSIWGKPGREIVQLWNQITDYDFYECFAEPNRHCLLSVLQESVLNRREILPAVERIFQDKSLQIIACPEIRREVETVYHSLVADLLEDKTLCLDDIALFIPDLKKYKPFLTSVFEQLDKTNPARINLNICDTVTGSDSLYGQGALSLLQLLTGKCTRKEVLDFVKNPCFKTKHDLDETQIQLWIHWIEHLHIFHSLNAEHKNDQGYLEDNLHTWEWGLQRLLWGTVLESPHDGEAQVYENTITEILPYADGYSENKESLAKFIHTLESLFQTIKVFRKQIFSHWSIAASMLQNLLENNLTVPPEFPQEAHARTMLIREWQGLQDLDVLQKVMSINNVNSNNPASNISLSDIVEAAGLALSRLSLGNTPFFLGAVHVADMNALRIIPFRKVYVLGLGESDFPGQNQSSALDLRQYRRVIGDLDHTARSKYQFLEMLLSVKEKLVLSYVHRDIREDRELPMSPVLKELIDYLAECLLPLENKPYQVVYAPLLSYSSELFVHEKNKIFDSPQSFNQVDARLAQLQQECSSDFNLDMPASWQFLIHPFGQISIPVTKMVRETYKLPDLEKYLINPLRFTLRNRWNLPWEGEEDVTQNENEPFQLTSDQEKRLIEAILMDCLQANRVDITTAKRFLKTKYNLMKLQGLTPEGIYQGIALEQLEKLIEEGFEGLQQFTQKLGQEYNLHWHPTFGIPARGTQVAPENAFPRITLVTEEKAWQLHGSIPLLYIPANLEKNPLPFISLTLSKYELSAMTVLKPFLFYLFALQKESPYSITLQTHPFEAHTLCWKENKYFYKTWKAWHISAQEAKLYLQSLLTDMDKPLDLDWLYLKEFQKELNENFWLYPYEALQKLEETQNKDERVQNLKFEDLLNQEIPADAFKKIQARFSLLLNL